jgi:hypothetical protein
MINNRRDITLNQLPQMETVKYDPDMRLGILRCDNRIAGEGSSCLA